MSNLIDFEAVVQRKALDRWLVECRSRMGVRYPKIEFDSNHWPVRTLHQTVQPDWSFKQTMADFASKDRSYGDVARCLVAELILAGTLKNLLAPIRAFRRLAATASASIFSLTVSDLRIIESESVKRSKRRPSSANMYLSDLKSLVAHLRLIASKDVVSPFGYYINAEVRAQLSVLDKSNRAKTRLKNGALLDHKMGALNDAVNAMLDNDSRLNSRDCVALCTVIRELCAPSRINEVLCCSVDDYVTIDDYAEQIPDTKNATHRMHQLLLITMKGSKGAQWSAKPALTFMIDAFHYTHEVILKHSQRSRMLVEWYQAYPRTVYLPRELESLRGQALSRYDLAKVMYLTESPERAGAEASVGKVFTALMDQRFRNSNPDLYTVDGRRNSRKTIDFLPWADVEQYLLEQVHQAMRECRKVTKDNLYEGDLSKMLYLFDRDELPYLPYALNYQAIRNRLKGNSTSRSLFEKLGITMPVEGRVQTAEIDTHDPRRWLTTMALRYGEKLSDVLINNWANRSSLSQLKAYDYRTPEEQAEFSRMPNIPELKDLSGGLEKVRKLEDTYGLTAHIVVAHDAGISLTSLDHVLQAVEDRPIARTSEQIIIIYPSRYGVCLHQHHETPCQRYDICITCDRNCCVKGHGPSNDAIREEETKSAMSVIRQLQPLVAALNRRVADHPDTFMAHLTTLVSRGLCLKQITDELIAEFHAIKDQIKDKLLRKRLEEAFVTRRYVQMLEDDSVAEGALMKYHNPQHHAAPGLEVALATHGGRETVARAEQALITKFPVFAPTARGLKDERHLIEAADEGEAE